MASQRFYVYALTSSFAGQSEEGHATMTLLLIRDAIITLSVFGRGTMGIKPPGSRQLDGAQSAPRFSVLSLGLGAFFASLLIYAGTVTPFLRYEGITAFVSTFAHVSLTALFITSAVLILIMIKGTPLHPAPIMGIGSVLYVLSAACFCYLALTGTDEPLPLYFGSVACGVGDCLLCLVWGKLFGRFTLRSALLNVALACLAASAVYAAITRLPPLIGMGLFMTCATVAVIVPLLTRDSSRADTANKLPANVDAPTTLRALASFADVITRPALGLLVFAFVMGLTCYTFVNIFDTYLTTSVIAAAALAACAFMRLKRPLTRLLYRDLIPLLAITTLAVPTIATALFGESIVSMFFTLLLYTFAAFLTLSTLCAIANASEFSSEFIFATALALFALASLAGLATSEVLSPVMANVVVTVVTTLYAFLMVVSRDFESNDPSADQLISSDTGTSSAQSRQQNAAQRREGLAQRCEVLAEAYSLTAREQEILLYLAEGHSGAYISDVLFISPNTVRTHIHNIYRKLEVSSRKDVLRMTKDRDAE